MKLNNLTVLFLVFSIGWMLFIFSFSSQHAEQSSQNSSGIVDQIIETFCPDFASMNAEQQAMIRNAITVTVRKSAHIGEYAILSILIYLCCYSIKQGMVYTGRIWISVSFSTAYAASDELHQLFVPGRSGEVRDVIIDLCGALLGCLTVHLVSRSIQRRKNKSSNA